MYDLYLTHRAPVCYHTLSFFGLDVQKDGRSMARTPAGKVFISYSHDDKWYLDQLQKHLKPHVRSGALPVWVDTQLRAGDDWKKEIETALAGAQIAILLVSYNFLASDFVSDEELPKLLKAAEERCVRHSDALFI